MGKTLQIWIISTDALFCPAILVNKLPLKTGLPVPHWSWYCLGQIFEESKQTTLRSRRKPVQSNIACPLEIHHDFNRSIVAMLATGAGSHGDIIIEHIFVDAQKKFTGPISQSSKTG